MAGDEVCLSLPWQCECFREACGVGLAGRPVPAEGCSEASVGSVPGVADHPAAGPFQQSPAPGTQVWVHFWPGGLAHITRSAGPLPPMCCCVFLLSKCFPGTLLVSCRLGEQPPPGTPRGILGCGWVQMKYILKAFFSCSFQLCATLHLSPLSPHSGAHLTIAFLLFEVLS